MAVWPAAMHADLTTVSCSGWSAKHQTCKTYFSLSFALLLLPTISHPVLLCRCWEMLAWLFPSKVIRKEKTTCSHLEEEGLSLRNFARGDALERGILPGIHLYVTQPREMRHLVCGRRTRKTHTYSDESGTSGAEHHCLNILNTQMWIVIYSQPVLLLHTQPEIQTSQTWMHTYCIAQSCIIDIWTDNIYTFSAKIFF